MEEPQRNHRAPIRRDLRAAAIGGLAATFVVAAAFTPRLVGGSEEVRVRNSSNEAAFAESTTTTNLPDTPADEDPSMTVSDDPTTTSGPRAPSPSTSRVGPTKNETTSSTTPSTTVSTEATTTSTTVLIPPPAPTNVTVRPATSYATWTYSDAVSLSWHASSDNRGTRWRIRYGDKTLEAACCQLLVTGLTPDTDYTFAVSAFNPAGESSSVRVTAHTRAETAPVLSSVVKTGPGSFHLTAPNLHSAFMYLVVPGIDTIEHPPIPVCSGYTQTDEVDCVFKDLAAGHWQVHSIRIVDRAGRATTYFADGRLQEYGLAAGQATTVAGPYRKTTLHFAPLAFDVS